MTEPSKLARPRRRHKRRWQLSDVRRSDMRMGCTILAAVGFIAACTERPPMLNSERIQATFGSYGIEVVEATAGERVSNLYSVENTRRTTRTWAEVRFTWPVDEALREEHAQVVAGGSIGEVFAARGWTLSKRDLRIGTDLLEAPDGDIAALMRIEIPREVAVHEYVLAVGRDGREIEYAIITERHHPAYLSESDLKAIYGEASKTAK